MSITVIFLIMKVRSTISTLARTTEFEPAQLSPKLEWQVASALPHVSLVSPVKNIIVFFSAVTEGIKTAINEFIR